MYNLDLHRLCIALNIKRTIKSMEGVKTCILLKPRCFRASHLRKVNNTMVIKLTKGN